MEKHASLLMLPPRAQSSPAVEFLECETLRSKNAGKSQTQKGLFRRTHKLLKINRNLWSEPIRTQKTNPLRVVQGIYYQSVARISKTKVGKLLNTKWLHQDNGFAFDIRNYNAKPMKLEKVVQHAYYQCLRAILAASGGEFTSCSPVARGYKACNTYIINGLIIFDRVLCRLANEAPGRAHKAAEPQAARLCLTVCRNGYFDQVLTL